MSRLIEQVLLTAHACAVFSATLVASAGAQSATQSAPRPIPAAALIGTWKLVSYQVQRPNGEFLYPYGNPSQGVLTYDASGRMAVQIMRPDRPKGAFAAETPEQLAAAFKGYVAYFGTYSVDSGVVVHHVEGSLDTWRIGVDQVRPFRLQSKRLVLEAEFTQDGERRKHVITWSRVSPP